MSPELPGTPGTLVSPELQIFKIARSSRDTILNLSTGPCVARPEKWGQTTFSSRWEKWKNGDRPRFLPVVFRAYGLHHRKPSRRLWAGSLAGGKMGTDHVSSRFLPRLWASSQETVAPVVGGVFGGAAGEAAPSSASGRSGDFALKALAAQSVAAIGRRANQMQGASGIGQARAAGHRHHSQRLMRGLA